MDTTDFYSSPFDRTAIELHLVWMCYPCIICKVKGCLVVALQHDDLALSYQPWHLTSKETWCSPSWSQQPHTEHLHWCGKWWPYLSRTANWGGLAAGKIWKAIAKSTAGANTARPKGFCCWFLVAMVDEMENLPLKDKQGSDPTATRNKSQALVGHKSQDGI